MAVDAAKQHLFPYQGFSLSGERCELEFLCNPANIHSEETDAIAFQW